MADLEISYFVGIRCDRCGAVERDLEWPLRQRFGSQRDGFYAAAAAAGWSRWVGRSLRDYCPGCAPGREHTMRKVW